MNFEQILSLAQGKNASDIILSTGSKPCLKIHGDIVYLEEENIKTDQEIEEIANKLMTESQKKAFFEKKEIDFAIEFPNIGRLRTNVFLTKNGIGMAFRIIAKTLPNIEAL